MFERVCERSSRRTKASEGKPNKVWRREEPSSIFNTDIFGKLGVTLERDWSPTYFKKRKPIDARPGQESCT